MKKIIVLITLLTGLTLSGSSQDKVIDKVVAIVGNEMLLLSDVEAQYIQYMLQKGSYYEDPLLRCRAFEELMIQKLLLTQARIDSIEVSDKQVNQQIDQKLNYYIMQFGSKEKFEEYYGKKIEEFKAEFFEITREQIMIEQVQNSIISDIKITPSEVRKFFKKIPKDSLPTLESEFVIGQIVRKPPIREEERQRVISELQSLKERALEGEDFSLLASLHSEDPGTAEDGGRLTFGRGLMDPVFEAASFDLQNPGDISDVIESEFGFHIIRLVKRSGDYITVMHILKMPVPKPSDIAKAARDLDNIKALLEMDSLTFEKAVSKYSQDPSKRNGGKLVNQNDGSSSFLLQELDEAIAFAIRKLNEGEVSDPVVMLTADGKKAYRLLYLIKKTKSHVIDLERDYDKVRSFALQEKQNRIMTEWLLKKIKETYVKFVEESYKGCDLHYKWLE